MINQFLTYACRDDELSRMMFYALCIRNRDFKRYHLMKWLVAEKGLEFTDAMQRELDGMYARKEEVLNNIIGDVIHFIS